MNDQQICPRLKAEERLRDLERIRGNYAITIAENVYSLWKSNHYPIEYFAEKYGFDIDNDDFLLDFIDLKIQQETGIELLAKREKADIRYDFDRHVELQRKASQRVYRDASEISFAFFWAIKHNAKLDQPLEVIVETEGSNLQKSDGLFNLTRYRKGNKVRRVNLRKSEIEKYKNTVYVVFEHGEHYVTTINSHGKKVKFLSHNIELIDSKK